MPLCPSQLSWVQFSALKGTVSGTSGGLRFRSSRGSAPLVDGGSSLALELGFLKNSVFSLTGDLQGTHGSFSAWITKRARQTCPIVFAATVAYKKRLSTPSTTASEFIRFGIISESRRPALNPSSSCCSTLVTSYTTF